jgi:DNA-binding NarL/FixJ family response regulator
MRVRIAVADPLPVFRRGVMAILREAGFETDAPDDLLAWISDEQTKAVVITVLTDADWQLLEALHRATTEVVLVVLLDRLSVADSVRALRAGAVCVMERHISPSAFSEAFHAAVRGQSLVPVDVLRALMNTVDQPPDDQPTRQEHDWLRGLAQGMTVARLAADSGYSERMMFRLLRNLYTRLGADNRTDALIKAQARGWLA